MDDIHVASQKASRQIRGRDLGYGERMRQIIGIALIIAGVVCFWLESADKSQADWRIDALGILLALFGLWLGNLKFKKNFIEVE